MLRSIRRTVTVVALAAAAVTASAGTSHAAAADFTCTLTVVAVPAVPRVNLVVGEVYGDGYVAEAVAACVDPAGGSTVGTLAVWFEFQRHDGAPYERIAGCGSVSASGPSFVGVLVLNSPPLTCSSFGQAWARRPVRAHAMLAYGGREYHAYSIAMAA